MRWIASCECSHLLDLVPLAISLIGEISEPSFGSGFEVGGDMARKNGFEIVGRGGVGLFTEAWASGMRSKHGIHVHGFPNLFFQGMGQNAA